MIFVTILLLFKHEERDVASENLRITSVYKDMWKVICLPSMRSLFFILLTAKVAFSTADNVTLLKLSEKGFPQEMLATSVVITFPFDIFFPILLGKLSQRSPNKSLGPYIIGYPIKIFLCLLSLLIVYTFPSKENITLWTYSRIILFQLCYSLANNMIFVSQCAFFARISDDSIGGTYMTLVNTIANLGGTWPKFFVLYLIDSLTVKPTMVQEEVEQEIFEAAAAAAGATLSSSSSSAEGSIFQDGYYIVGLSCVCLGVVWFFMNYKTLLRLQSVELKVWRIADSNSLEMHPKHIDSKLE
eukprot:TRINITY_DN19921_c0_g2_i1.p1 TRINITY_DN19921_c0_g2~~TRINITY_DN19921_c0_g2_i1.p1  ORF type:complete len:300 (-),score=72.98 TRINITY_DN19921_c0_g2_i1:31-930(-)